MAASVQQQVLDYVLTQLGAAGAPAPAYRSRTEAFTAQQMPAYNVYPLRGTPYDAADTTAATVQRFSFAVVGMVSAASEADVAMDPLMSWAWQKVLADPTLGGLVLMTELETYDWAFPPGDTDLSTCMMTFSALLTVLRGDPTAQGLHS